MPPTSFRIILFFACFGHAAFHVLVALFLTLVLVLEPEWLMSYDALIALWTPGALLLGLAAPVAGWLGDRWGEAKLMAVYLVGIGLACVVCGFSNGPTMLTAGLAAMGLFGAIYHPVGTAWVVKHATRRGKSIAFLGICGSIGAAFASLIAALLADQFGWRAAFIVPGLVTLAPGVLLAAMIALGHVRERRTDVAEAEAEPTRRDVRRAFIVLAVTMSMTTTAYYAITTLLPKWFERHLGSGLGAGEDLVAIGALVGLVYLIASLAQFVGGYFCDRGEAKRIYVISYALKLVALAIAPLIVGWPVVIVAIAILCVFDVAAPVENVLIARFTTSRRRGLAYGIRNGIAIVAGPAGVQLVALLFDEATGFQSLFFVLAALVSVVFVVALFLPADRPGSRAAPVGA